MKRIQWRELDKDEKLEPCDWWFIAMDPNTNPGKGSPGEALPVAETSVGRTWNELNKETHDTHFWSCWRPAKLSGPAQLLNTLGRL